MKSKRIIIEMILGAKEELRRRTHGLRRFSSARRIYAYIVVALFFFAFMSALSMEGLFLQHPVVGVNTRNSFVTSCSWSRVPRLLFDGMKHRNIPIICELT